jgi:hypothetical protein
MLLTKKELDGAMCMDPGCDCDSAKSGVLLSGRCHPLHPVEVVYRGGVLYLRCATCGHEVGQILVAAPDSTPEPTLLTSTPADA